MAEQIAFKNHQLNSKEVKSLCASDSQLALVINRYGDLTYSLHTDEFTFFVETIIGQMLSNKVADVISARLYDICDGTISVEAIMRLEQSTIKGVGLSDQKSAYIKGLASLLQCQPDYFHDLKELEDGELISRLTDIRGIGSWSAKMYLIFVLDRPDVLPYEDGAFLQAYKWLYGADDAKPSSIIKMCEPWKPYSSIASRYLYRALDNGFIQDEELNVKLQILKNANKGVA